MYSLILSFPSQLEKALGIASKHIFSSRIKKIENVTIFGMGGSGIGGTIVSDIIKQEATVPIAVCKGYECPGYIGKNALVIASSYSGNTEETLTAVKEARKNGVVIVSITSGGELETLSKKWGSDHVKVPAGYPPRAALGYSIVMLFRIFSHYKIISPIYLQQIRLSIVLLRKEQNGIMKLAEETAKKLLHKIPVIYSENNNEGVAVRFRQQLAENSKILAWHNVFPEMNHNELVGWTQPDENLAIILFRNEGENPRNAQRFAICREIFSRYTSKIIDLTAKGKNPVERTFYLIHLCDWVSYYLASLRGVDPVEVRIIDHLKKSLASK